MIPFLFSLKLRILIIIAVSLSKWICQERFCSAQWLAWELKLETNCKCFSAAEPVCSPGIITVITMAVWAAWGGLGVNEEKQMREILCSRRTEIWRCGQLLELGFDLLNCS